MSLPNPNTINLSNLVDIVVSISPSSAPRRAFNQLLIVGTTDVISSSDRIAVYQSPAAMITAGFSDSDPEYVAAQIYFSQSPAPTTLVVGRQDLTASPPESCLDAIEACRLKNSDWYVGICLEAVLADHKEIALWAESVEPTTVYAYTTGDAAVLAGTADATNIGYYLNNLNYSRSFGQYATTQSAVYPNNIHAAVAAMGYAMGQNTGLANSAFTLMFKQETGIAIEPINTTQIGYICGLGPDSTGVNLNVYLNYGNYYNILQKGVMADGTDFYETLGLDMLVNDIQLGVMDLLYGTPKVPQTDPGVTSIIHQVNEACKLSVIRGFIAPGIWNGSAILNLKNGDPLSAGFLVQAESVDTMTQAQRDAGKIPPIYVAVKLAGATKYVICQINVNR